MPKTTPKQQTTVADYLDALPDDRRKALGAVRAAIRKHLPKGYEEACTGTFITYQVPLARFPDTYNGQPLWIAALASNKSYLTLHLMPAYGDPTAAGRLKDGFAKAGKRLDMGKACIHFRTAGDLALDVIGEIIASTPVDRWIALHEAAHANRQRTKRR